MISIGPSTGDFDKALLEEPGALVWWYMDLIDQRGYGAVCIWSWGLPFLPGVISAAKQNKPLSPQTRPSLNLAIYENFQPTFYCLKEFRPEKCLWKDNYWQFDRTTITRTDDESSTSIKIAFDLPLSSPKVRAQGKLTVSGPLCHGLNNNRDPKHSWEPVTLGNTMGSLQLRCGDIDYNIQGRAYHDRNGGNSSLNDIGIIDWRWGRYAMPHGELVYTTTNDQSKDFLIFVEKTGLAKRYKILNRKYTHYRPSLFGPPWPKKIIIESELGTINIYQDVLIDSAPFYQRSLSHASFDDFSGPGITERVLINKLDSAWTRPFVSMRVDQADNNSIYLPLFNGPLPYRGLQTILRRGLVKLKNREQP